MLPLPQSTTLSVAQVQQHINTAITAVSGSEQITLSDGLNRILDSDIVADIDVPPFDNSAMDGYAFCAQDLELHHVLTIVGQAYAGHPFPGQLQSGQAVRITTGAPLPDYADSVLPQEQAVVTDSSTLAMQGISVQAGQHKRRRGEDIAAGTVAINQGIRLGPVELGLLASIGVTTISVKRKVQVAIFSTGDELITAGEQLSAATVYDSNRVTLRALLIQCGAEVLDLGVLEDNPATIEAALRDAANRTDLIITSGGVAGGAADFTKQVMRQLGQINFWSVNMRPGRPLAFGAIDKNNQHEKTYLFGLPGNPVAMMISFHLFVRPALQLLSGSQINEPLQIKAITNGAIYKKSGRTEFQRGIVKIDVDGTLRVTVFSEQGSAMLSSMMRANCLVVLSEEQENIAAGDTVKIILN
ncbi:molybdopterin molybdotransferase [Oxalobacteraceae bacterium GrIS 2.11]